MSIIQILQSIESAKGSRDKRDILLANFDNQVLKKLLWSCFACWKYGISAGSVEYRLDVDLPPDGPSEITHDDSMHRLLDIILAIKEDGISARDARSRMASLMEDSDDVARDWIIRIFDNNLRVGVSNSTFNKVWPDVDLGFWVVRKCQKWSDTGFTDFATTAPGQWIAEPKYDGMRCLMYFPMEGAPYARSTNGKDVPGARFTLDKLSKAGVRGVMLDGELIHPNGFNHSISLARSHSKPESEELHYVVFDALDLNHPENHGTTSLHDRWVLMLKTMKLVPRVAVGKSLKYPHWCRPIEKHVLDYRCEPSFPEFNELQDEYSMYGGKVLTSASDAFDIFVGLGFEGVVFKRLEAGYTFDRSSDWLKHKSNETGDFKVTAVMEGVGRLSGTCGALVLDVDGKSVNVGTGFSDDQRDSIWKRRDSVIGETCEVAYDCRTKDGSLRFPVFKTIRWDK